MAEPPEARACRHLISKPILWQADWQRFFVRRIRENNDYVNIIFYPGVQPPCQAL